MNWEELVEELEAATRKLRAVGRDDFSGVREAMNRRSLAVNRLLEQCRSSAEPVPEEIAGRIRSDHALGEQAREKLLLMRAEVHSEISRAAESSYLMRALARKPERKPRRVDCRA